MQLLARKLPLAHKTTSVKSVAFFLLIFLSLLSCIDREREQEEMDDPTLFLTLRTQQLPHTKDTLHGYIVNHARHVSYEYIRFLVTYYSHRGEKIGTEGAAFFGMVEPGNRAAFSIKIHPPPQPQVETAEIGVVITHASPFKK